MSCKSELLTLARMSIASLIKAHEDDAIGRTPSNEAMPSAAPGVPADDPNEDIDDMGSNDPMDAIRQAISVLEDGLAEDDAKDIENKELDSARHNELSGVVKYMKKALDKGRYSSQCQRYYQ